MTCCDALVSDGKGQYELRKIHLGEPYDDELTVKIKAAGICHTDWDSIQTWNRPFIVGHEGAGIVTQVGKGVTRAQIGDHVLLNWAIHCGHCFQCRRGNIHICAKCSPVAGDGSGGHAHEGATTLGGTPIERSFHLGTMSESTLVKEGAVVKIPEQVPFESAAIVGCGVMTGFGSVVNVARVAAGSSVCVIGCGGVGLNVIQAARVCGASKIIAIDIADERLNTAIRFGATHGVRSNNSDSRLTQVGRDVRQITGTDGVDYAFECTAIPELGAAPLALVRNAGTAVQVSGIEQEIPFDCSLFEWDKTYINPLYGQCDPVRDVKKIMDLYEAELLQLDELVTKTYLPQDVQQAFSDLLSGRLAKGVIKF